MTEEWRPIAGREGLYEVSSFGRVRSLTSDRILKTWVDQDGYHKVSLNSGTTPRQKWTVAVHLLVVTAFRGAKPFPNAVTRHLDGNPSNNYSSNLRWGTYSQNNRDKTTHGTDHLSSRETCNYGHPFDEANTYMRHDGSGGRRCRTCARDQQRKRYAELIGSAS